jgi:hypothetical protein
VRQGVFCVASVSLVEHRYALRNKGKSILEDSDRLRDKEKPVLGNANQLPGNEDRLLGKTDLGTELGPSYRCELREELEPITGKKQ